MTAQEVIDRVRIILTDNYFGQYRYSDTYMFGSITEASRKIAEKRPNSLFTTSVPTTTDITAITALADVLQINDRYKEAIENYVCYRCLQIDGEDVANMALASQFLEKFEYVLS